MNHFPSRLVLTLLAGLLSLPVQAAGPVTTVNGVAIPAARMEAMIAAQRAQGATDNAQLHDGVRELLIRQEVLNQEAGKKGFEKRAEVQSQLESARQSILINAYLQDFLKANPVTEADLKKEYDTITARLGDKEYKTRHVLVQTEEQAKTIITRLQGGAKFEELAKESLDTGSRERGGELGWSNPGMFVKPFSEAMVKLEKGKYTTTPVKTDYGYHVIQLEDLRTLQPPPYEEVKPQMLQRLQQQKIEKHVLDLRAKAKVQ